MYTSEHADAGTRGEFVKVKPGESMALRVLEVFPIKTVQLPPDHTGHQNEPYEAVRHRVHAYWHRDAKGTMEQIDDVRFWEPAAGKLGGLIAISKDLAAKTGNPYALADVDVQVTCKEEKNARSGRWFNVYEYEVLNPAVAPAAPPVAATRPVPPPIPAGRPVPPPSSGPRTPAADQPVPTAAEFDMAFAAVSSFERAEAVARSAWPLAKGSPVLTAALAAAYAAAKLRIGTSLLNQAPDQAALDAAWSVVQPRIAREPPLLLDLGTVYSQRQNAFGIGDDCPF